MKHPHIVALENFYSHFSRKEYAAALGFCAEAFSFQVPGKGILAGKYTRANFAEGFGGKFEFEIHDILASDVHATVLGTEKVTRGGKAHELRTVHVWRFEGGKPLAGYEYPRDLYAYDQVWSS